MTPQRKPAFERVDVPAVLADLQHRTANFSSDQVNERTWNTDLHRVWLTPETPGDPEPDGCWQTGCQMIADYDFCPPEIVRAAFDPTGQLLGRTMLLEGRFSALRLYLPVRITTVIDERRPPKQRIWGFSYDTLQGHLERGRLTYEVIKHEDSGHVEFTITAYSQRAPSVGPIISLGWALFGRRRQLLFYRRCGQRMQALTSSSPPQRRTHNDVSGRLMFAPSDARATWFDLVAPHSIDPG